MSSPENFQHPLVSAFDNLIQWGVTATDRRSDPAVVRGITNHMMPPTLRLAHGKALAWAYDHQVELNSGVDKILALNSGGAPEPHYLKLRVLQAKLAREHDRITPLDLLLENHLYAVAYLDRERRRLMVSPQLRHNIFQARTYFLKKQVTLNDYFEVTETYISFLENYDGESLGPRFHEDLEQIRRLEDEIWVMAALGTESN